MDVLLDPRNKPAEEFFIFLKIQDSRLQPKVQNRPNYISARHLEPVHQMQTKFGMDILLDPRNRPAEEFFIFLKSKMAASCQKLNFYIISAHKSHFGFANGSLSSDLDKFLQADTSHT